MFLESTFFVFSQHAHKSLYLILDGPNWNGTWRGSLTDFPSRSGPIVDVMLELGPYPTTDNTCTMWRNTYSEDRKVRQVKDYRLCRGHGADDLYIDEGYGVRLAARWIGGVLVTPFKYDDLILVSSMRLRGDILEEEILMIDDKSAIKGLLPLDARAIQRIEVKRVQA